MSMMASGDPALVVGEDALESSPRLTMLANLGGTYHPMPRPQSYRADKETRFYSVIGAGDRIRTGDSLLGSYPHLSAVLE